MKRIPDLGPVVRGGLSVLDHDLTHATGGLPGFPAFDDGFGAAGKAVLAPEKLTITRIGSAVRRDGKPNGRSIRATGASGIRYWFGHLEQPAAVNSVVRRGAKIGVISANHEEPHVHVGMDASALVGHELVHHTNYTHGAPTVRVQFEAHLETQ